MSCLAKIDDTTPRVGWTYSDPEGDPQAGYQVQIDRADTFDSNGGNPDYDSGDVTSADEYHDISPALAVEGLLYIRGRTRDAFHTIDKGPWATGIWILDSVIDSVDSTPVCTFTIPTDPDNDALHFRISFDDDGDFITPVLTKFSGDDQTGWEYYDGAAWQPFPVAGVLSAYYGNQARYTVQLGDALTSGDYAVRVQAEDPSSEVSDWLYGLLKTALAKELIESFNITDSVVTTFIRRLSFQESFSISDAITKSFIKSLIGSESFNISDAIHARISEKGLLESISVTDTGDIKITVKSLEENIHIFDSITKTFLKTLSEAVTIADVVETFRTAYAIFSEVISIADSVTLSGRFHLSEPSVDFLNVESLKNNCPTFDIFFWLDGVRYALTNRLISANVLNREMFYDPGKSQKLVVPDATLVFENTDKYLSDNNPGSILYKKTYMGEPIEIWAGFRLDDNRSELLIQANMKVKYIDLDTTKATATFYCYDELKETFDINVGMPLPDGTPNPLIYTNKTFKYIVEDLLINKAGISSNKIDIEDADLTFVNISFAQKKIGWCLQKLGEIAAGSFFVEAKIKFRTFQIMQQEPITKQYKYNENYQNLNYRGQDIEHAIKKIIVIGSNNLYREKDIGALGRDLTINNEYVESTRMADNMITAYQKRLAVVPAKVSLKGEYLPSYRVGTGVKVYETHSMMDPFNFHVVRVALDILKFISTIELAKIDFERVAWGEAYWGETYWNIEKSQFRPLEQLEESIVITDSILVQII